MTDKLLSEISAIQRRIDLGMPTLADAERLMELLGCYVELPVPEAPYGWPRVIYRDGLVVEVQPASALE